MESFNINVNVEVSLSKETLAVIRQLVGSSGAPSPKEAPAEPKIKTPSTAAPAPHAAPAPVADDDDLPPDDAPAPKLKPTPTEADARAAVKAAKDRGVPPKAVRAFMQEHFGITTSVDCPEDRRQELIDGLNNLAA